MPEQSANLPERVRDFEQAERQRKAWEEISVFVKRRNGWVVSQPGQRIRFQCQQTNTKLIEGLERIGFKPTFLGPSERLNDKGMFRVSEYEVVLPK